MCGIVWTIGSADSCSPLVGAHTILQVLFWFSLHISYLFVILDGQTEVSNLAAAGAVQKYVVRLDVKMQDVMAVQELQALYQTITMTLATHKRAKLNDNM